MEIKFNKLVFISAIILAAIDCFYLVLTSDFIGNGEFVITALFIIVLSLLYEFYNS